MSTVIHKIIKSKKLKHRRLLIITYVLLRIYYKKIFFIINSWKFTYCFNSNNFCASWKSMLVRTNPPHSSLYWVILFIKYINFVSNLVSTLLWSITYWLSLRGWSLTIWIRKFVNSYKHSTVMVTVEVWSIFKSTISSSLAPFFLNGKYERQIPTVSRKSMIIQIGFLITWKFEGQLLYTLQKTVE